ncbi:hypothetical protein F3Y22_tig00111095pilonHSYRG00406 [Hibiscus syriacus]|uniref:RRM domain-containing protein n=1 Tax=Hibiscus syriacus TaxID=106335 RepID=A0A6A2Z270_HIBSY|nr:hypothetical protein F3Y22_tig00111095pilonHSYRG00406 [Hibiscus syriacus]
MSEKSVQVSLSTGAPWSTFVNNLSRSVSRGALWERFKLHGKVAKVFIPLVNRRPKYRHSTFTFVHFESHEDLIEAVAKVDNTLIDGKRVTVMVAKYHKSTNEKNFSGPDEVGINRNIVVQTKNSNGKSKLYNKFYDGSSYRDKLMGITSSSARAVKVWNGDSDGDFSDEWVIDTPEN